jgi:hypothetical protein
VRIGGKYINSVGPSGAATVTLDTYINGVNVHPVTQCFEVTLSLAVLCDVRGSKYISSFGNVQTAVLVAYFIKRVLYHAPV